MDIRRDIEAIHLLSPQQEGMLLETLSAEGTGIFIEQDVQTLPGSLDRSAFARAWSCIVERHAVLRTAFAWKDWRRPLQVVRQHVDLPVAYEDWRTQPAYRQRRLLERYLEQQREIGFDLNRAPLMRVALFRTSDDSYEFVWTYHHILFDGWSRAIVLEELMTAHAAFTRGGTPPWPPARPYGSYVEWLRRQDLSAAETHWKTLLDGYSSPVSLGRPRPSERTSVRGDPCGQTDLELSTDLTARLKNAARAHRVTTSMVLHGAWAIVLSRCSGCADVVFGTTVSGRPPDLQQADSIVGPFMNTLPCRIEVDPSMQAWQWLNHVQRRHLEVRKYEYCSSGQIHQWSQVPGSISLQHSILVVESYPQGFDRSADAEKRPRGRFIGARSTRPLSLLAAIHGPLILRAVHDRRLIDRPAASRYLQFIQRVLKRLSTADCTVGELLALLPAHSIPRVAVNTTATRGDTERTLVPPSTPLESRILAVAREVLGTDRIGMDDRFFSLGGHSLLATQFTVRVDRAFQVELPIRVLFESRNMKEVAAFVESAVLHKIEELNDEEAQRLLVLMNEHQGEIGAP